MVNVTVEGSAGLVELSGEGMLVGLVEVSDGGTLVGLVDVFLVVVTKVLGSLCGLRVAVSSEVEALPGLVDAVVGGSVPFVDGRSEESEGFAGLLSVEVVEGSGCFVDVG